MEKLANFINGKSLDSTSGETTSIINPSTGQAYANAPKSNSAYQAINDALRHVRDEGAASVPMHLRGTGYADAANQGHGVGYKYSHDAVGGVVEQSYLPEEIKQISLYKPKELGKEAELGPLWARLRRIIRGK